MLKEKIKSYFSKKRNIAAVYLFGSHAKGKAHPKSDIDIAVLYKSTPADSFRDSLKISCDLMKEMSCDRVDVVVLNTANPVLKNQIYKHGQKILCNDPVTAVRFKAKSILEYLDILPMRRQAEQVLKRKALSYGR